MIEIDMKLYREDLSKMTYITMFIKETLRLYPPGVTIGKLLDKPLTLKSDLSSPKEVIVPEGSSVYVHIAAMHRHPLLWDNPEVINVNCLLFYMCVCLVGV